MDAQLQSQEIKQSTQPQSETVSSTTSSPPSPSHEFSFTSPLHVSSKLHNKAMISPSSFTSEDDLSPADHIFFHGHLLPLQFLSHLPVTRSSSSSTDSSDSFSLPIRPDEHEDIEVPENCSGDRDTRNNNRRNYSGREGGIKGKSLALLWSWKWIRRSDRVIGEKEKVKMKFQVSNVLKKYFRTIRPISLFRRRKKNGELREQRNDSFSGNSSSEEMQEWEDEMGFSAHPSPAKSMPPFSPITLKSNNTNDSTMEELQNAIQAAILYCKNSIAKEDHDKLKRQD